MNKNLLLGLLVFILVSALATHFTYKDIDYRYNESKYKLEKNLGETVVINGDTLTIVDYNVLSETYIMSNGTKVNYDLVEKLK